MVLYICTKVKKGLILVKGKVNKVANVSETDVLCGTVCVLYLTLTIIMAPILAARNEPTGKFVRVSLQ